MEILLILVVPLAIAVLGIALIANALESIKDTLDKNRK
jgi:uncharacterized protein YoxC